MLKKIKNIRIEVDGFSQLVKGLTPDGSNKIVTKETEKCCDSLLLAKAWLGKLLGFFGSPTPYANDGKRTDVNSIEPTADKGNPVEQKGESTFDYDNKNHIEKVDFLRQEIQKVIPKVELLGEGDGDQTLGYNQVLQKHLIVQYLSEARFWLGFELQRIKEQSE